MRMLADFITVDDVEWRRKNCYPAAYTNGGTYEVYEHTIAPGQYVWHSRRKYGSGSDVSWKELDLHGSHPSPEIAIKFVHATQGIERT